MTRTTFVACAVCTLVAAAAAAQTPAPSRPARPVPVPTAQTMTLTGCLEPWDPATMQVGGSSAGGVQQFVLTSAETATPAGATGNGATPPGSAQPPSGTTPVAGAHATYLLKPTPGMALAPWANQQVKVMGTLVISATTRPGMPTGTSGTTPSPLPTPTTSSGGTPTTSSGGTPTTSTGGTPTTSPDAAPMPHPAAAPAAATHSTFNVMSIALVQKTCS